MKDSPLARLVRPEQAAEILEISRAKLYEMMRRGELRSVPIGRCRRIRVQDIEEYIAARIDPRCPDDPAVVSPPGDDGMDTHWRNR